MTRQNTDKPTILPFPFSADKTPRKPHTKVYVRWMVRRDIHDVIAIEQESFECPWTEEEFIQRLRQRNCIGMVAEHESTVVGFMIYEVPKSRIRLMHIATAETYRRQGIGAQMVAKLVGKLGPQRRTRITLEVPETNLAAQLFFRQQGFLATSVLRDFYEEMEEDAYRMQYRYLETLTPSVRVAG